MSEPRPSRLRTVFWLIGGALLLLAVLLLAVFARLRSQVHHVARELTAEYRALAVPHGTRPSHVDPPTPGTFAQQLEASMPEVLSQAQFAEEALAQDRCLRGLMSPRPVSELNPTCLEWLEQDRGLVRRVVRLSRAEGIGHSIEDRRLFEPDYTWFSLERLLLLAALDVRVQTESGQPDAAVEICLDALALGRDLAAVGGELGGDAATHASDWLFIPCQSALSRASLPRLREASVALRHIREGFSPLSSLVHEGNTLVALRDVCPLLARDERGLLPAPFQKCVADDPSEYSPWDYRWQRFRTYSFLQWRQYLQQLEPLVDLPPAQQALRVEPLSQRAEASWLPIHFTIFARHVLDQARAVDLRHTRLELLLALTEARLWRAEHGAWPSALPGPAVPNPTALQLRPGPRGTLDIAPQVPDRRSPSPDSPSREPLHVTVSPEPPAP